MMPAGSGSARYRLPEPQPNGATVAMADLVAHLDDLSKVDITSLVKAGVLTVNDARLLYGVMLLDHVRRERLDL